MTDTEKILNLLEINEGIPALVTDEERKIITSNHAWSNNFGQAKLGKSFNKLFDKNTSLLIENSFIDAKAFLKIQRREVQFAVDKTVQNFKILLSPFKLDSKIYIYVLLYNESFPEELLVYPSLDENSVSAKYSEIIAQLKESLPTTLIEKKNLQFAIDSKKDAVAIKDKYQILFTNNSFNRDFNIKDSMTKLLSLENVFTSNLLSKIQLAENELFLSKSSFVIEKRDYTESTIYQAGRILLYPIQNNNGQVETIIIMGSIEANKNVTVDQVIADDKEEHIVVDNVKDQINLEKSTLAKIVYDKNDFDILDANLAASDLYGYEIKTLKQMNFTQLFPPEDMQKLLMPAEEDGKYIFKQITKDGSTIDVSVGREHILWLEKEACVETITLIQPEEEEIIKIEEFSEENIPIAESIVDTSELNQTEAISDFLSSLFHELLTPVNVILGFVQEIIDSIEDPTEEQEESAQIIKDNQQVLLQAMNTAVQYAQLDENKIKLNIEEFDVNNYLVDLQDSFSRASQNRNINVIFDDIPDTLSLKHDRSKLLAAISYFIKFVIKLTDLPKVFVSLKITGNDFYVLVKDSESGISENVSSDMFEIFNSSLLSGKKNYGIAPITIRLAKKINELLSVKVIEHSTPDGVNSIAFVTSAIVSESSTFKQSEVVQEKIKLVDDQVLEQSDEVIEKEVIISEPKVTMSEKLVNDDHEEIANGEVDEKIAEDIEEEEEIVTEEIATVESLNDTITDFSNLSCLFIDDTVDAQLLFKAQMKDFKLLKVSSNLTEALPLLNKYNFDLVIVDINLNDTYNGFDALKIIRQFNNYQFTPIIAATAYSFQGDREKFINFGFSDYFVKPLLREQLLKSLEVIIS